ncbi:P-loop containing nucleoside triphosphate hydrolase protein [Cenococcum geophilum]
MAIRRDENQPGSVAGLAALDQLLSPDQSVILGVIENLRPISKYEIDLPRIIVCGDQSCGKSSVLEAISRLNFPRAEKQCTTFATELTLEHQNASGVSVSIIWENPRQGAEEFRPKDTAVENLSSTINEAKRIMERRNEQNGCAFFKDVLKIKASNPSWPPLTLVDLPGLIHAGEEKDLETVREIVRAHMEKAKTIILAVVAAPIDHENQEVLQIAQHFDPEGRRTMGIITKPDRVDGPATEKQWIHMAKNKSPRYRFELGWHVVRNRAAGEEKSSFGERDRKEEEFFSQSAWKRELEPDQLGIDNLRAKLSKILEDHTRSALPGIIKELERKLKNCKRNLESLGPSRITPSDQQKYLARIGGKFKETIEDAVCARYDDNFFSEPRRRYYAYVWSQNDRFVEWMYGWGHTYEEKEHPTKRDLEPPIMKSTLEPLDPPEVISRAEFIDMIKRIQMDYRGHELPGMCNPEHLNLVFRNQSQRWRRIAEAHLETICTATHQLLRDAVRHASGPDNDHTATALMHHIIIPEMETKQQTLFSKLDEMLRPYEKLPVTTHDPEFLQRQKDLYGKRWENVKGNLTSHIAAGQGQDTEKFVRQRLADYKAEATEFPSDSSQILDLMKLYYKNALRTFIDNVVSLAIANCLVYELPNLFTLDMVQDIASKNESLLQALASEPPKTRNRRATLEEEHEDLQKALDECKRQLGDINMYIIDSAESFGSSPAYPSVNVLPPGSSPVAAPYPDYRSTPNTPSRQPHSRASSVHSTVLDSTPLIVPSPEGSVSGREGGRRHFRQIPSKSPSRRVSGQHLPTEEEL